jgi:hypothetical protein
MPQREAGRFLPSMDGFTFSNDWPAGPAITVPAPWRPIGLGNAARGLCGGMVFAALDYWHAGLPLPRARPEAGSPLYRFIVRRLIDSWHLPGGVARYFLWMNLPDADRIAAIPGLRPVAVNGVSGRTVDRQWLRVRTRIDGGHPVPLGVVTMASARPWLLGRNHQALAYGYELDGSWVTLRVYDPNSGPSDDVAIRFDPAAPTAFLHNINIGWPVRGFFLTGYSPVPPPG